MGGGAERDSKYLTYEYFTTRVDRRCGLGFLVDGRLRIITLTTDGDGPMGLDDGGGNDEMGDYRQFFR